MHKFNAPSFGLWAPGYTHSKDVHLAIKFEDLYYLKLLVLDSWFIASRTIG